MFRMTVVLSDGSEDVFTHPRYTEFDEFQREFLRQEKETVILDIIKPNLDRIEVGYLMSTIQKVIVEGTPKEFRWRWPRWKF